MKTILAPIDFSPVTGRVCDEACALARRLKARVVLLHVIEPVPSMVNDYAMPMQDLDTLLDQAQAIATRKIRDLAKRCTRRGARVVTVQRTGKPVPTILAKIAELRAGYAVIGSQGHTAAYDLLIGSVLQGVLRKAACPVLVVPAPGRRAKR
jgi:nucleotide-binding universal stress UspA family protein